jgi:hypothetical protein
MSSPAAPDSSDDLDREFGDIAVALVDTPGAF